MGNKSSFYVLLIKNCVLEESANVVVYAFLISYVGIESINWHSRLGHTKQDMIACAAKIKLIGSLAKVNLPFVNIVSCRTGN